MEQTIKTKHDKHDPLIEGIRAQGWNVNPLIVILPGERSHTLKEYQLTL